MLKALVATGLISSVGIAAVVMMFFAWGSNRYELVVEFELDGQRYKGSTVWEISAFSAPDVPAGNPNGPTLRVNGEAIDVPLNNGKTIFVLRRHNNYVPSASYGSQYWNCVPGDQETDKVRGLSSYDGPCELAMHPWIVIADEDGHLETIHYDPESAATQRVTILSTIATSTVKPMSTGIVDRHSWIAALPSDPTGGALNSIYFEDFSRR